MAKLRVAFVITDGSGDYTLYLEAGKETKIPSDGVCVEVGDLPPNQSLHEQLAIQDSKGSFVWNGDVTFSTNSKDRITVTEMNPALPWTVKDNCVTISYPPA